MYNDLVKQFGDYMIKKNLYTTKEREEILKKFDKEFIEIDELANPVNI